MGPYLYLIIAAVLALLGLAWILSKSAALGDTYVCRGCGQPMRSEEVTFIGGAPYCSYGCEVR